MTQLTSRTFVDIAGLGRLRTKPGAKFNKGGVTRKAVVGDESIHGFQEELVPPSYEGVISHTKDLDTDTLTGLTNATITITTDSGNVWVIQEAWCENPMELADGSISVRFVGKRADKVS